MKTCRPGQVETDWTQVLKRSLHLAESDSLDEPVAERAERQNEIVAHVSRVNLLRLSA
jgi:hypothetical protein